MTKVNEEFPFSQWPFINIKSSSGEISANRNSYGGTADNIYNESIGEVLTHAAKFKQVTPTISVIIQNVGDYDAQVTKDGVEINGYTIPFAKIKEIEEVVKTVKG